MSARIRWIWLSVITLLVLGGAVAYAAWSFGQYQQRQNQAPGVAVEKTAVLPAGPHVLFRNTATGSGYGHVASVPLDNPQGVRSVTNIACDRVYSSAGTQLCLRTNAGIATTFEAVEFNAQWQQVQEQPLPGNPSRVRVSPDGKLFASTVFVMGHAYAPANFSTATVISRTDGPSIGNLEDFTLLIDGKPIAPVDRNLWGVTFAKDPNTFYATAASGDKTWLVKGDLAKRTLTSVRENAECPSISPDGTKIAYKKNLKPGPTPYWNLAVLDLATNNETVLVQPRSVDDQAEWLDDSTLLYGIPREGAVGDEDVWSVATTAGAVPQLFIEHAWSPSVVR
ncbi:PD40 domain-containing protein [Arthrobacter sp. GMC3]|uniref:PD40 domain-containing protein n=1 Tax=Arthrobacter sp. GMC3 TaxID=2058894 RepID=UPI000CE4254C|nr:PD40 domain-containing protein [Arthrobacter sp. GMC3]